VDREMLRGEGGEGDDEGGGGAREDDPATVVARAWVDEALDVEQLVVALHRGDRVLDLRRPVPVQHRQ
jgi:hypothetical protein